MALTGSDKAYLQARSGIARSGASRSNYVFPLYGVITVNGIDVTPFVQYGTLRVALALNEQPDTATFDVRLTNATAAAALVVGAEVLIGMGGPADNVVFGGRILTMQTRREPGAVPSLRSVMCADYLQVLDSEYLVTYTWPPQSATLTIRDLIGRFFFREGGVAVTLGGVPDGLPSHARVSVSNERASTVLRQLVTMFPAGGGFYVDPQKVLHVWSGASEPNVVNPAPLTLANPRLKAFAETIDGAQQRDAVIVEGVRTTAPIGTPGPRTDDPSGQVVASIPVTDASILDQTNESIAREVRIGTQRYTFARNYGVWSAPVGTSQSTVVTADVPFNPDPSVESNQVTIFLESVALFTGRNLPWFRIDEQVLMAVTYGTLPSPNVQVYRTGYGAMTGAIAAGAVVSVVDSLGTGIVTFRYDAVGSPEQVRPQPIDSDVVMTVRSTTGFGVHEQFVQDGRFSRAGAAARGQRELADFAAPLGSIQFETDDLNARPGRLQAYDLADPIAPMSGDYMILTAELTWPVWGQPPRRVCTAADVHTANVVDSWLMDPR